MERLFSVDLSAYPSTCPTCISAELTCEKAHYRANLVETSSSMNQLYRDYLQASIKHEKLKAAYEELDRKASFIPFFLAQEASAGKTSSLRKSSKPRKQSAAKQAAKKQADIIATLLAMLTPEQQALVAEKASKI